MKNVIIILFLVLPVLSYSQSIGINESGTSPHSSAILDIQSNDKGMLVPRMDSTQRKMIANPAIGLLVFDISLGSFNFYDGISWVDLSSPELISDKDRDTQIEVEKSADEDTLRFTVGGYELARMTDKNLDLESPGNSVFIGKNTGLNDDGSDNFITALGHKAGEKNTIGFSNTYIGANAGNQNMVGNENVFLGTSAGLENTGSNNVLLGRDAGRNSVGGSGNTYIGADAGRNAIGSGNVFIGKTAGENENGSDKFVVNNGNPLLPLLYGDFSTGNLFVNRPGYITPEEVFGVSKSVNGTDFGGMFIETNGSSSSRPFYGFAINGLPRSYIYHDGGSGEMRFNNFGDRVTISNDHVEIDGQLKIAQAIEIGNDQNVVPIEGTIRWNSGSQDFEGYTGSEWKSLTLEPEYNFWGNANLNYISTENNKILASDGSNGDNFGNSVSISGNYAVVGASHENSWEGAAYVLSKNGTVWTEMSKITAIDGSSFDEFGTSVAISGDIIIVGMPYDNENGSESGSAYIFKRSGNSWTQEAKLLASDGNSQDFFGRSVSISGDYAIVGAYGNDDSGSSSGSAYIFKLSGGSWIQEAKLLASDGAINDSFGRSVSISGDYVVIGAHQDDDSGSQSGSAYLFKRNGSSWTQEAKLLAIDGATGDKFGYSVAISNDYVIIGSYRDDDNGIISGSAYIFYNSGSGWVQEKKLLALGRDNYDDFGISVSISGNYAIVGAYNDDENGLDSGSAYIFRQIGGNWIEESKLIASDGEISDKFGFSVAIYGNTSVVGAFWDDDLGSTSGSVYIFH
ncbi:MAG: hypothetical protein HKN68_02635 [Saprospiraceae bacterium]|nr:hypothetical protein [Saprospiraceae bacterium]